MISHHPRTQSRRLRSGASLAELLVVIVVFLIGILALVQVFPPGLAILGTTRTNTIAANLARAELERLRGTSEQVPEAILAVRYQWNALRGDYDILVDLDRRTGDLAPRAARLDMDGDLYDADGRRLGSWPYFSGANVQRRVIGEGRVIPAPRFVEFGGTTVYGGVMALQFAPVVVDPRFAAVFIVYGNDLQRDFREDVEAGFVRRDYVMQIDEEGQAIALPGGWSPRRFRLSMSAIVRLQDGRFRSRDVVTILDVPASPGRPAFFVLDATALTGLFGIVAPDAFVRLEVDTVRAARVFERLAPGTPFNANPAQRDDAAYQYKLLDHNLGLLLFNPQGFNYVERRGRGRAPMRARVDYDVLDWRLIRDDFRVPARPPYQQKLILDAIKVLGDIGVDRRRNPGLGLPFPDAAGNPGPRDFAIVDLETGGVFLPTSYRVDKSHGLVTFLDEDADAANGLTARLMFPGAAAPAMVSGISGRSVRALYMGQGEMAVQVIKPASAYFATSSVTLGFGQTYVGGSNDLVLNDSHTRLYFPQADIGKKVVVGEAWYRDAGGVLRSLQDQEFLIQAPQPGHLQLGWIDIRDKAPDAQFFDWTNGYAVRRVRGASVEVRVLWNPEAMSLTGDEVENITSLENWQRQMRGARAETFLVRSPQ
jgi:hypothetical protein